MKTNLELRMYFFVPYNISEIQKGIQAGHAAIQYAREYGDTELFKDFADNHKTWIILNGGTTNSDFDNEGNRLGSLNSIADFLLDNNIKFSPFVEPDLNNALSAVCFIADERVWNYGDYPNFGDYVLNYKIHGEVKNQMPSQQFEIFLRGDADDIKEIFPEWYEEWVEFMGGKENIAMREILKNKKFA